MGVYRGYGSGNSAADPTNAATTIGYSNTTSGLVATTAQAAIDELDSRIDTLSATLPTLFNPDGIQIIGSGKIFTNARMGGVAASGVSYNTGSEYYFPLRCPSAAGTVTNVKYKALNISSTSTRIAVYRASATTGLPTTLIGENDSGSQTGINTVFTSLTADFTYAAGELLWVGFKTNNAAASYYAFAKLNAYTAAIDINSTTRMGEVGFEQTVAYGTAFASSPSLSVYTAAASIPFVYFEIL